MLFLLFLLVLLVVVTGCNTEKAPGKLTLAVSEAPVATTNSVYLAIRGASIAGPEQELMLPVVFSEGKSYRQVLLPELAGSASEILISDYSIPSGEYLSLNLFLETSQHLDSYIILNDGSHHELSAPEKITVPMGKGYKIDAGENLHLIVDIDLQNSLVYSALGYHIDPEVRLVNHDSAGHLTGNIDVNLLTSSVCFSPSVYLFKQGAKIEKADKPVSIAQIDSWYQFRIGFLHAGQYDAYLACKVDGNSQDDAPVNQLNYIAQQPVEIRTGELAELNFHF